MSSLRFCPQDLPKSYIMRERRLGGGRESYNFRSRIKWYPAGWGFNKKVIGNQFSNLHYLACRAPKPIQKKWANAYDNFMAKHFASKGKASVRFLNKYTCHSWL